MINMKIQNPHYKFFKEVFSNTEVAADHQTGIEYFETFIRYIMNAGRRLTKKMLMRLSEMLRKLIRKGVKL